MFDTGKLFLKIAFLVFDLIVVVFFQKLYLSRLKEIRATLEVSPFFKTHEVRKSFYGLKKKLHSILFNYIVCFLCAGDFSFWKAQ